MKSEASLAPTTLGVDPRELAQHVSRNHGAILSGCDEELRRAIGAEAITFLAAHPAVTLREVARLAPAFFQRIRNVPYKTTTAAAATTIGNALFDNAAEGAPIRAVEFVLRVFVQAGTVRETLVQRRDELTAAVAAIDRMTVPPAPSERP